jgi:HAMP domain-containing protein
VAAALADASGEIGQLKQTVVALREELEKERADREQAIQSGRAEDRAEIAQLQGAIQELRQRLELEMSARQRDRIEP